MHTIRYGFQVGVADVDELLPQVSRALEKRTELLSRRRYPRLWERTDRLNPAAQGQRRRGRLRSRIMSAVCLLLGVFLFVPGSMAFHELTVPFFAGAAAIAMGVGGLWFNRKKRKNAFEKSAKKLLAGRASLEQGRYEVLFSAQEMAITDRAENKCEYIPYSDFECVIETEALFLLFFCARVSVLLKRDLCMGSEADFRSFLSEKTVLQAA